MKYLLNFVVVSLVVLWSANAYSKPPSITPDKGTTENQTNTAKKQDEAKDYQTNSEATPFYIKIVPSENMNQIANKTDNNANKDTSPEKITAGATVGLAIVTAFLAAITGFLALYTYRLWTATKTLLESAEKTTRIHERAYVHAGGDFRGGDEFCPDVGNYGKTPAIVSDICIEVCSHESLPAIPDYSRKDFFGLPLYPGEKPKDARVKERFRKGIKKPVVYVRVWYEDIFKDKHSSGFIYGVKDNGSTYAIKAPSAYSECN